MQKKDIKLYSKNFDTKFLKNVITLSSGTLFAQAITIFSSPIITRFFTPAEMGGVASIMAIVSILGVVSTGRYELAIVLPKKDSDSIGLACLGIFISFIVSVFISSLFIIFGENLLNILKIDHILLKFSYFIGLLIFFVGVQNVFSKTAIRFKLFKSLAVTQIIQTGLTNGSKIVLGLLEYGITGLFIGTFFGSLAKCVLLISNQIHVFVKKELRPTLNRIIILAKKYKKFPIISSWSILLNTASLQMPVILFTSLYSPTIAGFFVLCNRILNLPIAIIGNSVSNVFIEKAANNRNNKRELQKLTFGIYKKLLLISTIILSIITFYGGILFEFVFGADWYESGIYAQWLSISIIFQLSMSPISSLFSILEKQLEGLIWSAVLFILRIFAIVIPSIIFENSLISVKIYFIFTAIAYLIYGIKVLFLVNISFKVIITTILKTIIPILLLQFSIRYVIKIIF